MPENPAPRLGRGGDMFRILRNSVRVPLVMLCPKCGATMRIIAFLTDFSVADKIIHHLKLTFIADKPPPPHLALQEFLMAAETPAEYFS